MEFKNNVLDLVVKIANELYPNTQAEIWFGEIEIDEDGVHPYGCTTFPDDGSKPVITIGIHTPIEALPEILAHEISHVIAGVETDHNKKWENIFDEFHNKWMDILHNEYGMPLED